LLASAGAAVSLTNLTSCSSSRGRASSVGGLSAAGRKIDRLAGLTLAQLRDQYRRDLFDDFLPFMDKFVIDHELGGFFDKVDRDGAILSMEKSAGYLGLGLWVYSCLYNELSHQDEHLIVARQAADFLFKNQPDQDSVWPAAFTRQGQPLTSPPTPPHRIRIFADLIIANGFAEYSRAVGQEKYWQLARQTMFKCKKMYDQPDYAPQSVAVYYQPGLPELPGARRLGLWMLFLQLGNQLLNQQADSEIDSLTRYCVEMVLNHHYIADYDLINEVLNHDLSRAEKPFDDLVYLGHALEIQWMIMQFAFRRGDQTLFEKSAQLLRRHLEVAWDDVYGGCFRCLKSVAENTWLLDKASWVQEESLIGLMTVLEHTAAPWAGQWFSKIYTYVREKFPLQQYGYSLWNFSADRKVTFTPHAGFVDNFHHPRHLLLNLLALDRLIARRGKPDSLYPAGAELRPATAL